MNLTTIRKMRGANTNRFINGESIVLGVLQTDDAWYNNTYIYIFFIYMCTALFRLSNPTHSTM